MFVKTAEIGGVDTKRVSFMNTLYACIFNLCSQCGITPGKLCTDIGISRGILSDLKAGRKKTLNAETAYKIAKYFGVSVGYLLGYEDK